VESFNASLAATAIWLGTRPLQPQQSPAFAALTGKGFDDPNPRKAFLQHDGQVTGLLLHHRCRGRSRWPMPQSRRERTADCPVSEPPGANRAGHGDNGPVPVKATLSPVGQPN